ncbi:hypothetical protein FACS189494_09150 [Spirochaetia bacterium]|nr:hypothetical protein FACS189494_09150 [Spirochaetia bacterium]
MTDDIKNGWFVSATIGQPFALEGFLKIHSISGEVNHLLKLQSVVLRKDKLQVTYQIERIYESGSNLLVKFTNIDTPEDAKKLSGSEVLVKKSEAAPLKEYEFYIEELKGLHLINKNDEFIGVITDVTEGGGGNLIEIKLADGELRLIPFCGEFIGEVSVEKGKAELLNEWILE